MATKKGIWNLQQTRDKQLQSLWDYFDVSVGNGQLFTWGANERGTLGLNDRTYRSSPTQIFGGGNTWSVLLKGGHTNNGVGAIKSDGTLWQWGRNDQGQLGQNQSGNADYSSPVQVGGNTWKNGATSRDSTLVTKTDGTLWAWGAASAGVLGQNNNTSYSSPVQIPGTIWDEVFAGYETAAAVKTNNQLWMWGNNDRGQTGQNDRTNYSSPKQVSGSWTAGNNTSQQGMASRFIKTDGTLWSWGYNNGGGLGLNNITQYSSPVQVGSDTNWSTVGGSSYNGVGTKTDGTLWTWGTNNKGILGQNQPDGTLYSSPVQVPGTNWAVGVIPNNKYIFASKTDGTLWSWGYGVFGFLGNNDRINYSSPIQIPGTWSSKVNGIGGAVYNGYGIKPIDS